MTDLLLPVGTRLVHIGPPKTATTSLQSALTGAEEALADQDVFHPGLRGAEVRGLRWLSRNAPKSRGAKRPAEKDWDRVVEAVRRRSAPRTVLSNEFYTRLDRRGITKVVEDLGGDDVHVALTLRPLVKLLPSQWQQFLKYGSRTSYDDWLHEVFDRPRSASGKRLWLRQRHDELVERWVDVIGADRVSVVVLDPSDRQLLTRTFEQLLGLREGTLVPQESRQNRSLTAAETDLVLAYNRQVRPKISMDDYIELLQGGAERHLLKRRPGPHEAKITTPAWAEERARALGAEMGAAIARSGARILGDLEHYTNPRPDPATDDDGGVLTPEVASRLAAGMALSGLRRRKRPARAPGLEEATWRELTGALASRVRRRLPPH